MRFGYLSSTQKPLDENCVPRPAIRLEAWGVLGLTLCEVRDLDSMQNSVHVIRLPGSQGRLESEESRSLGRIGVCSLTGSCTVRPARRGLGR